MPDVAVEYVLTTPTGSLTFNDGGADQFYIQEIQGLVQAPIRAPIDQVPFGDGAIGHNFWQDGRHAIFDGVFLITSLSPCDAQMEIRNEMEEQLQTILESISGVLTATGTLVWRPRGLAQRTLTVRCDVPLECVEDQNFLVRNFHFGLFAADPNWVEST